MVEKLKAEFILMWKPLDLKWCGAENEPVFIDHLNKLIDAVILERDKK